MSTCGVLNTGAGWFSELPDLITICVLYHITDSLAYKGQVFSHQDTPFGIENLIKSITRANLIIPNLPVLKTQVT